MRALLVLALLTFAGCQCGRVDGGQDGGDGGIADAGGDGGSDAGSGDAGTICATGQLFEQCHPWTTDVYDLPKHDESDAIIGALADAGGWGSGNFRTERSPVVLTAPAGTPFRTFTTTSNFYTPDCDHVPFPVPATGAIEGETGFACTGGGDCHLLVVDVPGKRLYEMWKAN